MFTVLLEPLEMWLVANENWMGGNLSCRVLRNGDGRSNGGYAWRKGVEFHQTFDTPHLFEKQIDISFRPNHELQTDESKDLDGGAGGACR